MKINECWYNNADKNSEKDNGLKEYYKQNPEAAPKKSKNCEKEKKPYWNLTNLQNSLWSTPESWTISPKKAMSSKLGASR